MGFLLRKLTMKVFFFQIFALNVGVVCNLTPDDHVAPALKIVLFDFSEMTEIFLFAINQVPPCQYTPEEMEISKAKVVLYTKHVRKDLNATKCQVQHKREK